jgi:hypothetical protein
MDIAPSSEYNKKHYPAVYPLAEVNCLKFSQGKSIGAK